MSNTHLSTYLNDHLAGSVSLTHLLEHLQQIKAGQEVAGFLAALHREVVADRRTLEQIMECAQVDQHTHRTAMAWLAEKVSRLKLRLDDPGDGALHLLEALELVEVGLEGKRALWRALAAAAEQAPLLQGYDYDHLMQRAQEQHDRVEAVRTATAKTALTAA